MRYLKNPSFHLFISILIVTLVMCFVLLRAQHRAAPVLDGHYEWPHWLGPERNGATHEQLRVDRIAPKLRTHWSAEVGSGCASFAIVGDRLYTSGARKGKDTIFCFDARTGKRLWRYAYPCPLDPVGFEGGPSATPAVDGGRVFAASRGGDILCLDAVTGEKIWTRNAIHDLHLDKPVWGFAGSPFIAGDYVILNLGCVVALNKTTGAELWRSANLDAAYSTPAMLHDAGRDLLAIHGHAPGLALLDPRDGAMVTSFTYPGKVMISTPIVLKDRILITASEDVPAHLLELTGGRLIFRWKSKAIQSWLSTPVIVASQAYGFQEQALCCVDMADGRTRWVQPGIAEGALTLAGDELIVQSGDGTLLIASASPEGYRELARQKVFKTRSWVAPVLCNGLIYCRSNAGKLVCLAVA